MLQCANRSGASLEPFHASAALITIPHALLKAKALRMTPELKDKERAAEQLEVGQVFKIVLRFRQSFWEDDGFLGSRVRKRRSNSGDLNFIHAGDADIPVW